MADCSLCGGRCANADLEPLLSRQLAWLWEQVAAAADRRGDPGMASGHLTVRAPADPAARAEAVGLLGGRLLSGGQSRRVDLADLTSRLRVRGEGLTPGAVAAHATGRALAEKAREQATRAAIDAELRSLLAAALHKESVQRGLPADAIWAELRRTGWTARLHAAGTAAPAMIGTASAIIAALPLGSHRVDRRRLANDVLHDPHGLNDGTRIASFVLALLTALGDVPAGLRARQAWDRVGVDYDDLTGGVITLGVHPVGWTIPVDAVLTLPPRELARCMWPEPPMARAWVFVTENPSVLGAAAQDAAVDKAIRRILCTVGTPSDHEVSAIARLAQAGWQLAVRADFDEAGLTHVTTLLDATPNAVPWRMDTESYVASLRRAFDAPAIDPSRIPATPWAPDLADMIRRHGQAAYEESLLDQLLRDLKHGHPAPHAVE